MRSYVKKQAVIIFLIAASVTQLSCKDNDSASKVVEKDSVISLTDNPYQSTDQSPLDISYCPDDYPQQKMKGLVTTGPVARVIYSRPHKKGRIIFSDDPKSLCQYGKPWRLGANESTEIEFFQPVMVGGKNIDAGRYVLYCIPHADKWEIVFNSNLNSWGLQIDPSKDVFRTEVPAQQQSPAIEDFTMIFRETAEGAELLMSWDNVKTVMPVTFSK